MIATRALRTVIALMALAACRSDATSPWAPVPDVVTAVVLSVDHPPASTRVLVDAGGSAAPEDPRRRYYLVLSRETAIVVRQPTGALVRGRVANVTPGARIRAWRTGVELRSATLQYPVTRVEVTAVPAS